MIGAGTVLDRERITLPTVSTVVLGLRGEMIRGRLGGAERDVLDKSALYLQLHVSMLTGVLCVAARFIVAAI